MNQKFIHRMANNYVKKKNNFRLRQNESRHKTIVARLSRLEPRLPLTEQPSLNVTESSTA
jgi:hypothetical protein